MEFRSDPNSPQRIHIKVRTGTTNAYQLMPQPTRFHQSSDPLIHSQSQCPGIIWSAHWHLCHLISSRRFSRPYLNSASLFSPISRTYTTNHLPPIWRVGAVIKERLRLQNTLRTNHEHRIKLFSNNASAWRNRSSHHTNHRNVRKQAPEK